MAMCLVCWKFAEKAWRPHPRYWPTSVFRNPTGPKSYKTDKTLKSMPVAEESLKGTFAEGSQQCRGSEGR